MAPTSQAVVIALAPEGDRTLETFLQDFSGSALFSVRRAADREAVLRILEPQIRTILLSSMRSAADFKILLDLGRALREKAANHRVTILVLDRIGHPDIDAFCHALGDAEAIDSNISPREMRSQILNHLENTPRTKRPSGIRWRHPLNLRADCWLLRSVSDIRLVRSQWIIELYGPGPTVGRWERPEKAPFQPAEGTDLWKWQPLPLKENPFPEWEGTWFFQGKRPQMVDHQWMFVSDSPRLSYAVGDKVICDYFIRDRNGLLSIHQNSESARAKWPAIRSTNRIRSEAVPPGPVTPPDPRVPDEPESSTTLTHAAIIHQQIVSAGSESLFSPIQDRRIKEEYLLALTKKPGMATLWTTEQKLRFSSKARCMDPNTTVITVPLPESLTDTELSRALAEGAHQLFVNINLPRGALFFRAQGPEICLIEDHLHLTLPDAFYEVQRRTLPRVTLEVDLPFVYDQKSYRAMNLSGGGITLSIPVNDETRFAKGDRLESIAFTVAGRTIHCSAEVRWAKKQTVGLKFLELSETDRQRIKYYVLEQLSEN